MTENANTYKTRREALGLTQQQLATQANITTPTLSRLENGKGRSHSVVVAAVEAALVRLERRGNRQQGDRGGK